MKLSCDERNSPSVNKDQAQFPVLGTQLEVLCLLPATAELPRLTAVSQGSYGQADKMMVDGEHYRKARLERQRGRVCVTILDMWE